MWRWFLALSIAQCSQAFYDPNCDGKQVIVHLFEWKWTDVADECERYLSSTGFCGVQVSPPTEHVILPGNKYPWWQRYQPVSYKLFSRSGNEDQFADMVRRCNNVGVRVYVDVVVNHMTGTGMRGVGDGGSFYDSSNFDFPGVPYKAEHFTPRSECPHGGNGDVNNYDDPKNVRNCFLVGLADLYGRLDYVRQAITGYFNHLVDLGIAGIRIDAAKHMWPADIAGMLANVKPLSTDHGFTEGSKLFVYQEVIDNNDGAIRVHEYYDTGLVTEFRFCRKIARGIRNYQEMNNLVDFKWGMAQPNRAFIFVDNHDNQRGHGGAGDVITHKTPREYKQAVAYTLAQDYGFTRIMSSYLFESTDQGPPHNDDFSTADVPININGSCGGGWVCEHRWTAIANMVKFRNAAVGQPMGNYFNNGDLVAFSRGNVAFFAMAKDGRIDENLQTGLPAGTYCNIIDDCKTSLQVGTDSRAQVYLKNHDDPILAVCIGCDGDSATPFPIGTICHRQVSGNKVVDGVQRTVVFIYKQTYPGQSLFLRGGINQAVRKECTRELLNCTIPVKLNSLGDSDHYAMYDAWRRGDTALDWFGAEKNQGLYFSQSPQGTPMVWTSNNPSNLGYQVLNRWGDHYWMVDFDMDCSKTEKGWFEVQSVLNYGLGWESDVSQASCQRCEGSSIDQAPYVSKYHLAKCGSINMFTFGTKTCEIYSFSNMCGLSHTQEIS